MSADSERSPSAASHRPARGRGVPRGRPDISPVTCPFRRAARLARCEDQQGDPTRRMTSRGATGQRRRWPGATTTRWRGVSRCGLPGTAQSSGNTGRGRSTSTCRKSRSWWCAPTARSARTWSTSGTSCIRAGSHRRSSNSATWSATGLSSRHTNLRMVPTCRRRGTVDGNRVNCGRWSMVK